MPPSTQTPTAAPTPTEGVDRSFADRAARWLLRVEGAEPRALMPLKGSLMMSAVRCLVTYVAIPVLLPVISWLGPLAAPLSLVLSLVAMVMAVVALRRVWLADWAGRWPYTVFVAVVVVVLTLLVATDVRTLAA